MFKNYLIVALRHLRRGRAFTLINVAGLALGLAACLLILLYVQDEFSYDRHHEGAERIYRITQAEVVVTPPPLAPALTDAYPSVTAYVRLLPSLGDVLIKGTETEQQEFYESRFYWADSMVFDVFTFPLIQGDPRQVLTEPNTVVITDAIAQKYFGDADPIGKRLILDIGLQAEFQITGIMQTPPRSGHFRPDFLASMATFDNFDMLDPDDWSHAYYHSYIVLDRPASAEAVQAALPTFVEQRSGQADTDFQIQPITDIHLRSKLRGEPEPSGSLTDVYSFAAIALLILLIACINFTNLATARSAHRAREIGMRKTLGAHRASLVVQFLGESVLLTLIALALALPLVYLLLPVFNNLAGKTLTVATLNLPFLLLFLGGMTELVGVVAGSYPAFFLARFRPHATLRGSMRPGASGLSVRKVLVVGQFAIGIGLIVGTLVIYNQLQYVRAKNLGFVKERVAVVSARMYGHAVAPVPYESIAKEFAMHPEVLQVAVTGDVPGTNPRQASFLFEGMTNLDDMDNTTWNRFSVDYDFIETMGIEVIEGRSFSREVPADERRAFIINEAALRGARAMLGADWSPIDKKLDRYLRAQTEWVLGKPGRIIGVVRDFHYQSLHHRIAPLVLQMNPQGRDHFVMRLQAADLPGTLAHLESVWKQFLPDRPFEYYFLDASFDRLYRAEQQKATLLSIFTILSLIIACLGLFGLAAFTAEQRTKEIGVRKVLGASLADIVVLLSKGFAGLVLVAFVVATPLAYFGANWWLANFAYRVDISWPIFLIAGLAALGIAVLTVGYQAVKAAMADPVESLRYE